MNGLMMDRQLLVKRLLWRAEHVYGQTEALLQRLFPQVRRAASLSALRGSWWRTWREPMIVSAARRR
jgi:hypothetical protein